MMTRTRKTLISIMALSLLSLGLAQQADAGPGARGAARSSVNADRGGGNRNNGNRVAGGHNTNVHGNNVNVNNSHNDVNINVENNDRRGYGYDDHYHPVATAAAVTATVAVTSAVVGAILTPAQMPPSCVDVMRGNVAYRQCGNTWYQPQYQGSNVTYIVVNAP
ncbi:hypothetical protein JCM19000A_04210 [Silvimonas sp. JCM 19000]